MEDHSTAIIQIMVRGAYSRWITGTAIALKTTRNAPTFLLIQILYRVFGYFEEAWGEYENIINYNLLPVLGEIAEDRSGDSSKFKVSQVSKKLIIQDIWNLYKAQRKTPNLAIFNCNHAKCINGIVPFVLFCVVFRSLAVYQLLQYAFSAWMFNKYVQCFIQSWFLNQNLLNCVR